jgi:hypothetical protein
MVSLVEQEPLTFMSTWVHPRFLVGFQLLDRSFLCSVLEIVFCPVFVWSMCCLSFNLRILIDPLVSSNSSNHIYKAVYIDVLLFFVSAFNLVTSFYLCVWTVIFLYLDLGSVFRLALTIKQFIQQLSNI